MLGAELARCFETQGIPLPPWRHADALLTRYDGVASSAGGSAAPAASAAAAAKQQAQQERVHLRLLKLGVAPLPAAAAAAAPEEPATPSPPSPHAALSLEGSSPSSVLLPGEPSALSRALRSGTKAHERVCCGYGSTQQQQRQAQELQQQWQRRLRRRAASAA